MTNAPATGSDARDCTLGEGDDGTGFLNSVTLTVVDGEGGEAEACAPAPDEADVAIVKTGTERVLLPNTGGSALLSYTLMVTNNGPTEARDVVVTDTMPRRGHGRYGHAFRRKLHQFRHVIHLRPRSARRRTGVTIGVQASITDYMNAQRSPPQVPAPPPGFCRRRHCCWQGHCWSAP